MDCRSVFRSPTLCLYRVDSPDRLRLHVVAGETRPIAKSAIAEVLCKFQAWPPRPGSESIDPSVFTADATDADVGALAMPVFCPGSTLIGVLAMSGPVARLTPERVQSMGVILSKAA
jgi:DNA-binding IclR family transcriptional regulator